MGFANFFKQQFSTVIEWRNPSTDVLFYKFSFGGDEIKNASKLIVAPGQGCLLVYEGKVTGLLDKEGVYTLQTANEPLITTLLKLMQGFKSEHKLKIYFYRKAEAVNQSWGTSTRVKYQDPVYRFLVSLGAYGNYSFRLTDAQLFLTEITGLPDVYTLQQARILIQSRIEQQLTVLLASATSSVLQIDSHLNELTDRLSAQLNSSFAALGFTLTDFQLQGTSLDKETQSYINHIGSATAGSLAAEQAGLSYAEMEKLKALRDAANNSSAAGAGLQFNVGAGLNQVFSSNSPDAKNIQPDAVAQLQKLKLLLDQGILTAEEYEAKKKVWLEKL